MYERQGNTTKAQMSLKSNENKKHETKIFKKVNKRIVTAILRPHISFANLTSDAAHTHTPARRPQRVARGREVQKHAAPLLPMEKSNKAMRARTLASGSKLCRRAKCAAGSPGKLKSLQ